MIAAKFQLSETSRCENLLSLSDLDDDIKSSDDQSLSRSNADAANKQVGVDETPTKLYITFWPLFFLSICFLGIAGRNPCR